MSLYADYLHERTTDSIVESSYGFATYRYINEGRSVYIVDIYVVPNRRKEGVASWFADHICKEAQKKGCTEVIGTVVPSMKGSTTSAKVLFGYGFEIHSAAHDLIVFRKEI